ncbi:MAG: purine-binding chemotaxis protein CheW [Thermodesulfovibrionia bacterium]|nr:purine-binding chemotaxis protein CheW [Thermodesulfovibrionia bacterium]MCK5427324.1 purine-binding chemotaxis protein CheW [Thermodesulfovibrionia bacterium]MCK5512179.1 purine-binding chemotaxis protein CheW [Thermodesulfovibrionia bacterium]
MDKAHISKKVAKRQENNKEHNNESYQKGGPVQSNAEIEETPKGNPAHAGKKQANTAHFKGNSTSEITGLKDIQEKEKDVPVDETEILAFKIGTEEYAIRMAELQEIIRYQRITAVPCSPNYLVGVTSVRGKIIPVVDLKVRLGMEGEHRGRQKIIILSGKKGPLGALVTSILGAFRFPSCELLPPPSTLTEDEKNFIEGVAKINNKFISILNIDEITKV